MHSRPITLHVGMVTSVCGGVVYPGFQWSQQIIQLRLLSFNHLQFIIHPVGGGVISINAV